MTNEELERLIRSIYKRAKEGVQDRWQEYSAQVLPEIAELQYQYDEAKKNGDKEEAGRLGRKLAGVKKEYLLTDEHYTELVNVTAAEYNQANKTAASYINGELPDRYIGGFNAAGEAIEDNVLGYSFEMTDANTVKRLIVDEPDLLPTVNIDTAKDLRWNKRKIDSEVLQGILQGEPMDKIAKRLTKVAKMNEVSAIRNARTAVTSAENGGRLDGMKQAEEDGIILRKKWLAADDERTRDAHREMDGQIRKLDEPFTSDLGDIMFPADPSGQPANVYNCRCTMTTEILGFRGRTGKVVML